MDQETIILNYLRRQINVTPQLLQDIIGSGDTLLPKRLLQQQIESHIDNFLKNQTKNRWIVIPGLRGVGKTTILAQTYLYLHNSNHQINLLYLSLDEMMPRKYDLLQILEIYEHHILGDYFENLKIPTFIFIDEIQSDNQWALALKAIYDRSKLVFFICSGSSALHLQMDANIAGRRARIETLYPLNFNEFQLLDKQLAINHDLSKQLKNIIYYSETAQAVYDQLTKIKALVNRASTNYNIPSLSNYLQKGTLPIFLNNDPLILLYKDVRGIMDKIIHIDLRNLQNFNTLSLTSINELLHILATSSDIVSLTKLSQSLGLSKVNLINIFNTLIKAEVLIKIPSLGNKINSSRRPVKYLFTSATIRASYFDLTEDTNNLKHQGFLLEDIAGLHYYKEFTSQGRGKLFYYYSKDNQKFCDFILRIVNSQKIAIEFGLGNKNNIQVINSMKRVNCKYGLVFSKTSLSLDIENNIVSIPLEYFLLI